MGTRADFYIKKANDETIIWCASIAWDGYPSGIDDYLLSSSSEDDFISNLSKFLSGRTDVTLPENGWPWPWDDSRLTDYAYIFNEGRVMCSCFGGRLFDPTNDQPDGDTKLPMGFFPDMSKFKNVRYDHGSGLIVITRK